MERNPVCANALRELSDEEAVARIEGLPNESIYDGPRAAQPDEVWNFLRGDGVERAVCLASVWRARHPEARISLDVRPDGATLNLGGRVIEWPSSKGLAGQAVL